MFANHRPQNDAGRNFKRTQCGRSNLFAVGARSIRLFRPVPEDIYVHSEQLDPEKSGEAQSGFLVTDSKGDPVMQVIGLQNRRLPGKKENPQGEGGSASTVIEEIVPIKLPTAPLKSSKVEGLWLVLSDDKVLSAYLKNFLAKRNCKANIMRRSDIDDVPTHWIAKSFEQRFRNRAIARHCLWMGHRRFYCPQEYQHQKAGFIRRGKWCTT